MATGLKAWLAYSKERFPLATYALLSGGIATSSSLLGEPARVDLSPIWSPRTFVTALGVMLFFFTLRLMDELKDFTKDQIAHPERPLPRGLLTPSAVATSIYGFVGLMAIYGAALLSPAYLGLTVWLWLMYKEFYVGDWLARSPLFYAVTHQVILLPLASFGAATWTPELGAYAVGVLGSFFTYEVCRKLDPAAHPVLKTYVSVYGYSKTLCIIILTSTVAALGALKLGSPWLWAVEITVPVSFVILLSRPSAYKLVEALATLSLLLHLYAGTLTALQAAWPIG